MFYDMLCFLLLRTVVARTLVDPGMRRMRPLASVNMAGLLTLIFILLMCEISNDTDGKLRKIFRLSGYSPLIPSQWLCSWTSAPWAPHHSPPDDAWICRAHYSREGLNEHQCIMSVYLRLFNSVDVL